VQNLDINPMLVFDEGQGCLAVDVKIQIDGV
jgi:succinyl-CoA synthetase beta subunit